MTTSLSLFTDDDHPYNVVMDATFTNAQQIGELLPRRVITGVVFRVEVSSFKDLARIVAALTPGSVATVRDALRSECSALGDLVQ